MQPATQDQRVQWWPVLFFLDRESEQEGVLSPGQLKRKLKGKGPDACFAPAKAYTMSPAPRKHTFYPAHLEFHRCWVGVVKERNPSVIKRISLLIGVALVAAMMLVATAAPAFAANGFVTTTKNPQGKETSGNCKSPQQDCTVTNRGGQTVVGQSER